MDSKNSPEISRKSRLEQDREDPSRKMSIPTEEQTQFTEENNVRQQLLPRQREGINVPQVSQNTNKCLEQSKSTMPKYADRPQVTETQISFYPDPIMKPPPRLPDKKSQNDGQINMDLDI